VGLEQKMNTKWRLMTSSTGSTPLRLSDIVTRQAIFNCGTAGHVMHGKSTLVRNLTGQATQRYQAEKERNITIKLGYANVELYYDRANGQVYTGNQTLPNTAKLLYTISFVDCPGHELYMATMVSGSKIMDHALMVVAANEQIPQPQTHQHMIALEYSKVSDVTYVLNKLDLIKRKDVPAVKATLDKYLDSVCPGTSPVIFPISAATGSNIGALCQYLAGKVSAKIPYIVEATCKPLLMNIVRSYNVNRPNTPLEDLVGAVVGGTIERGVITVGDQVEIRPGVFKMLDGKRVLQPLVARVVSLQSDQTALPLAIPGGLIGVSLSIYAGLSNNDRLKGQVLGHVGTLPEVYDELHGKYRMLADISTTLSPGSNIDIVVNGIMVVGSNIVELKPTHEGRRGLVKLRLKSPVVLDINDNNVALMIGGKLVASLKVTRGTLAVPIVYPEGTTHSWRAPEYSIVDDLEHYSAPVADFDSLLEGIDCRTSRIRRHQLPTLPVNIQHKNSYITATDLSAFWLELESKHPASASSAVPLDIRAIFIENLHSELAGSQPRYNSEGSLVLDGRYTTAQISAFVTKFVDKLLKCPSCRGTQTALYRSESIERVCSTCPATTYLHTTHMGRI
jgi:translation initiation factor 2 subunit 3